MDVQLAWKRVKNDLAEKYFISPLFLTEIFQSDLAAWLANLEKSFVDGTYNVGFLEIIDIPKGKGMVRPGSLLKVEDNIFYNVLVQECYIKIAEAVNWSQGKVDYGYVITSSIANKVPFFTNNLDGWTNFRDVSMEMLSQGYTHVVITDITGFYENINIGLLISDLKLLELPIDIVNKLSNCLNKWAITDGKGLPQGNSASDVLAKLYMNTIDQGLSNNGFSHLRYVDDIRVFCKSEIEAKKSLLKLTHLLRKRGLNIQTSKTKILTSVDAYFEFMGVQAVISEINKKIEAEQKEIHDAVSYEPDIKDIDEDSTEEEETSIEAIKSALDKYFINGTTNDFNKSLFHFILNRLIKEKDSYAFDYCISILSKYPEETKYILKYSQSFDSFDIVFNNLDKKMHFELIKFLTSEDAIYYFQNYQILNWLSLNVSYYDESLIKICRSLSFDNNKPYFIRCVARYILGKTGNQADIDSLVECINASTSEYEKAELVCCLGKMEKGRKSALFARIQNNHPLINIAVRFAKNMNQ
jgi:hypothetical protein